MVLANSDTEGWKCAVSCGHRRDQTVQCHEHENKNKDGGRGGLSVLPAVVPIRSCGRRRSTAGSCAVGRSSACFSLLDVNMDEQINKRFVFSACLAPPDQPKNKSESPTFQVLVVYP